MVLHDYLVHLISAPQVQEVNYVATRKVGDSHH